MSESQTPGIDPASSPEDAPRRREPDWRRLAPRLGLANALIFFGLRFVAWRMTGSNALLAAAGDALLDVGLASMVYFALRLADRPADPEHRWGHGKAEPLAAFTEAMLLIFAALAISLETGRHILEPEPLRAAGIGIAVTLASLITTFGLFWANSSAVRQTGSSALAAERLHYLGDVALNTAVLLALILSRYVGWTEADPLFALVICLFVAWGGARMLVSAAHHLLDHELPASERASVEQTILASPGIVAVHDLRSRDSGKRRFIEFHVELDPRLSLADGHAIADAAEQAVKALYTTPTEVTSHIEPSGIIDARLDELIRRTEEGVS